MPQGSGLISEESVASRCRVRVRATPRDGFVWGSARRRQHRPDTGARGRACTGHSREAGRRAVLRPLMTGSREPRDSCVRAAAGWRGCAGRSGRLPRLSDSWSARHGPRRTPCPCTFRQPAQLVGPQVSGAAVRGLMAPVDAHRRPAPFVVRGGQVGGINVRNGRFAGPGRRCLPIRSMVSGCDGGRAGGGQILPRGRTSFDDAARVDSSLAASRLNTLLDSARPHRTDGSAPVAAAPRAALSSSNRAAAGLTRSVTFTRSKPGLLSSRASSKWTLAARCPRSSAARSWALRGPQPARLRRSSSPMGRSAAGPAHPVGLVVRVRPRPC